MSLFDPEPPDNVVEFRRREPSDAAELEALARAPRPACRHAKRVIDADQREVHCRECGQKLDPIWCLLNLVDYREAVDRKLAAIREHEDRLRQRQQRAVAHKERRRIQAAASSCRACGGTGWRSVSAHSVERCACRTTGAPRLV